MVNRVTFRP